MASGSFGNDFGMAGAVCGAAPQREVFGWVDSLDSTSERLLDMAATLEGRLSSVTSTEPQTNECDAKQSQAGCELAQRIQRAVIGLNEAERRLTSILRRLEV